MAPEHDPPWPPTRCPPWCTGEHHATDHPEDRRHRSEAVIVPVTLTEPPTYGVVSADEWLVYGHRGHDDVTTWLSIGSAEAPPVAITMSLESAHRLCAGIVSCLAELES